MTHTVDEVRKFIQEHDKFYIAGHINPDGDSIGSCFGLGLALIKLGKTVKVLMGSYHSKYNVIPGKELVCEEPPSSEEGYALICVDCADIGRLEGHVHELALNIFDRTLCVDHHYSNTSFAKYNYVDGTASSTCEMVYRILDGFAELDIAIASAIYSGMVSDTGGFRHAATSEDTLKVSSKLTAIGIPFTTLYTELIHLRTYTELKILAKVLDACDRCYDASVVHVCVPKSMRHDLEDTPPAATHDLEGIVEYLLNIRRAKVSLLLYELDGEQNQVKISLRSRTINVGAIAQHFGGGGHKLAAGATVTGNIYEIRDTALSVIKKAIDDFDGN